MNATNLISLQSQNKRVRSFPQTLEVILSSMAANSKNTAKNYRSFYKEFFMYTLNKQVEDVTWDDVLSITYDLVLEYVQAISVKNNSKTVSTKIASLQSLYKELHKINRDIDVVVVSVKPSKAASDKDNSWGSLTTSEVQALYEYCDGLSEIQKPYVKRMFFETAFVTAIRKSALLNMKWDDLSRERQDNGTAIWVIQVRDKTGIDKTPISDALYDRLAKLKELDPTSDKVFNVTDKTLALTLSNFCKAHGISKDRNIVIHSLKKSSMDKVFNETGDITLTAAHGHHSGLEMSYKHYLGKNRNLMDKPSYNLFDENISIDSLDSLSKEDLIKVISSCSESVVAAIVNKAKEII